jgi:hypothetical protein
MDSGIGSWCLLFCATVNFSRRWCFQVVLLVNKETGQFEKDRGFSRGFVFMKENTDLINF